MRRARPARPAAPSGPLKFGAPKADQPVPLFPGCDVILNLDGGLKLRGAPGHYAASFYALVLEHTRHHPRTVHVVGATPELRDATSRVVLAAFPDVEVTTESTLAESAADEPRPPAQSVPRAQVGPREAQSDVDAPAEVRIVRASQRGIVATQPAVQLYPGCDVHLHIDLSLRNASLHDTSTTYALALEHARHDARAVIVDGNSAQRWIVAALIATAFPTTDASRRARRRDVLPASRPIPAARVVTLDQWTGRPPS